MFAALRPQQPGPQSGEQLGLASDDVQASLEPVRGIAIAKPQKAFAVVFAIMAATLAGCASGLGANASVHESVGMVSRIEEGRVVDVRPASTKGSLQDAKTGTRDEAVLVRLSGSEQGYAYIIRLRTGELVSVVQPDRYAIRTGTPVVIEYAQQTRVIPQNASIGYY